MEDILDVLGLNDLPDLTEEEIKKYGNYVATAKYRVKNRDKINSKRKDQYWKNRDSEISRTLLYKYGITLEEKQELFKKQEYKCAICKTDKFCKYGPMVDHCHITGKIRGILCGKCNKLLGMSNDSIEVLEKAIQYLKV